MTSPDKASIEQSAGYRFLFDHLLPKTEYPLLEYFRNPNPKTLHRLQTAAPEDALLLEQIQETSDNPAVSRACARPGPQNPIFRNWSDGTWVQVTDTWADVAAPFPPDPQKVRMSTGRLYNTRHLPGPDLGKIDTWAAEVDYAALERRFLDEMDPVVGIDLADREQSFPEGGAYAVADAAATELISKEYGLTQWDATVRPYELHLRDAAALWAHAKRVVPDFPNSVLYPSSWNTHTRYQRRNDALGTSLFQRVYPVLTQGWDPGEDCVDQAPLQAVMSGAPIRSAIPLASPAQVRKRRGDRPGNDTSWKYVDGEVYHILTYVPKGNSVSYATTVFPTHWDHPQGPMYPLAFSTRLGLLKTWILLLRRPSHAPPVAELMATTAIQFSDPTGISIPAPQEMRLDRPPPYTGTIAASGLYETLVAAARIALQAARRDLWQDDLLREMLHVTLLLQTNPPPRKDTHGA